MALSNSSTFDWNARISSVPKTMEIKICTNDSDITMLIATLHKEQADVVLLDMNFNAGINTGNEGLFWLSQIKKEDASVQVVLFTAYADIDLAVRGIKEGATDFVVKPWDNDKLVETLQAAYHKREEIRKGFSSVQHSAHQTKGSSMQSLIQMITKKCIFIHILA